MKRFVVGLAFTVAISYSTPACCMQAARPVLQAAPRFFSTPSFLQSIPKFFGPLLRLSTPTGSTPAINAWSASSNNSNGKLGMSLATATALTTAFFLFIAWYSYRECRKHGYSLFGLAKRGGTSAIDTGLATTYLCLTTIGKVLLFGLAFWGLESALLYSLERAFHISTNNPQFYTILSTLLAAGFYALITNSVRENMRAARIATELTTAEPLNNDAYIRTYAAQTIPKPLNAFIENDNRDALRTQYKPLLIIGSENSGKSNLQHDVLQKARTTSYQIPCIKLVKTAAKNASELVEQAFEDAITTAQNRGANQVILWVDDLDLGVSTEFINALIAQSKENTTHVKNQACSVKVIVLATAKPVFLQKLGGHQGEFTKIDLTNGHAQSQESIANDQMGKLIAVLTRFVELMPKQGPFVDLHAQAAQHSTSSHSSASAISQQEQTQIAQVAEQVRTTQRAHSIHPTTAVSMETIPLLAHQDQDNDDTLSIESVSLTEASSSSSASASSTSSSSSASFTA